jgi:zinc protease
LTKGITADELALAKTGWETGFVRGLQQVGSFGGRADRLNSYNTYLGDPGRLLWDRDRYTNATAEGVRQCAAQYLQPDGRVIIQVYPKGELASAGDTAAMAVEPPPAKDPTFTPPRIQEGTLANGMKIMLVEKHDLPLIQVDLQIGAGWTADPPDRFGVSAMTADLLTEGTKTMDAIKISDAAQRLGAQLGTYSGYDIATATVNALKKNLDPSLKLLADVVLTPTFPQAELDRTKENKLGQIRQEAKQAMAMARKVYVRQLYGADHPYGQPGSGNGTPKSLAAITRDELVKFYNTWYLPNNTTAVVVGDITMDEAKAKLEKAFGGWKAGTVPTVAVKQPKPLDKTTVCIVDKPGAAQSAIMIGNLVMPTAAPDFLPTDVAVQVLGGGSADRLYLNLRQDKGYTYGAYSGLSYRKGPAALSCAAQVQTEFTKESIVEFLKELRGITGERPITTEELAKNKDNIIKGYPQNFQTYPGIAGQLDLIVSLGLPENYWSTYVDGVRDVTVDQAMRMAKQYIHPDALLIVVVGDRQKIEPKIRELNLGEIVFPSVDDI